VNSIEKTAYQYDAIRADGVQAPVSSRAAAKGPEDGIHKPEETVVLSENARLLSVALASKSEPNPRVDTLRNLIRSGTYSPDIAKLSKILSGILK